MMRESESAMSQTGTSGSRVWPLKGSIAVFTGILYVLIQLF
ncbi:MAG: hypothetical protein H6Q72_3190 [Firmicutes bacterium]|nr:hypothetical protein [Bacillota bacterium]